jgi:hypothetical protein
MFEISDPSPDQYVAAVNLPNEPVEMEDPEIPPSTNTRSELESSPCQDPDIASDN